ncbi:putative 60S ribosomal protein L22-like [Apostichopus japonicus]|uniref:Large ribosomal subunit protein eL22 n=1 Tax=Stichopus japonicus TaxID=307972 RepID=A0A2G8KNT8_STIJA|nr:putative 60S ribosomal protein L22-like [Apostichopus japonicus]
MTVGKSKRPRKLPIQKGAKKKKVTYKFTIDCTMPVEDGIMDSANFEQFLQDRIKVDGKTKNFTGRLSIERKKSKLTITTDFDFSKRYLKYLQRSISKRTTLGIGCEWWIRQGDVRTPILPDQPGV